MARDKQPLGTILLFGAAGQVGSALRESLAGLGPIVPVVRPRAAGAQESAAGQDLVECDLTDRQGISRIVQAVRPTWIVNAAAYTAVDAAEEHRDAAMAVNAVAPRVLADEASRSGAALIHYSTDYVFNGGGELAWREEDTCDPVNFYGASKLAGEEAIRAARAKHLILRTSWVYAPRGHNFVNTMLRLAGQRPQLDVVDDQIGTPTSARFIAEVTSRLIAQAAGDPQFFPRHGGTLHVACGGETSWYDFATEIFLQAVQLGLVSQAPIVRPIPSTAYVCAAKRPLNSRLDLTRLRQEFAIEPPSWSDELAVNLPEFPNRESSSPLPLGEG